MARLSMQTICCEIIKQCMKSIGNLPDDNISCDEFKKIPIDVSILSDTAKTQLVDCIKRKIGELQGATKLSEDDLDEIKTIGELCDFVYKHQSA